MSEQSADSGADWDPVEPKSPCNKCPHRPALFILSACFWEGCVAAHIDRSGAAQ